MALAVIVNIASYISLVCILRRKRSPSWACPSPSESYIGTYVWGVWHYTGSYCYLCIARDDSWWNVVAHVVPKWAAISNTWQRSIQTHHRRWLYAGWHTKRFVAYDALTTIRVNVKNSTLVNGNCLEKKKYTHNICKLCISVKYLTERRCKWPSFETPVATLRWSLEHSHQWSAGMCTRAVLVVEQQQGCHNNNN